MSSDLAIRVSGVSKCYNIYESPMHRLVQSLYPRAARVIGSVGAQRLAGQLRERRHYKEFWALHGIDFSVRRGETIGVVGKNGSGKSTLLQMIAGTLAPTTGDIEVNGRVAALLELGSGFNPDFTGIENVRLNAAVLGLSAAELDQRMDAILAFADIGDFVNRPVKTYSSGMVVRLAFAVQAQVDPDVLIVDEALSVGDAKFQSKCFARLDSLKEAGTSILFVSHSTEQIVSHCDRAILLHEGLMHQEGQPKDVVHTYLDLLFGKAKRAVIASGEPAAADAAADADGVLVSGGFETRPNYNPYEYRWGDGTVCIEDFRMASSHTWDPSTVEPGDRLKLMLRVRFQDAIPRPIFGLTVKTKDGVTVFGTNSELIEYDVQRLGGRGTTANVTFEFDCRLGPGDYFLSVGVASHNGVEVVPHDRRYDSIHLNVNGKGFFGLAMLDVQMDAKESP
ncbi:ABC transporter ATP-binding protein [Dyella sp. 2RAB6]|uniref:ABC transporter ATP-binding protein n=1 Tax=Dyella sp. 2RAB6 TaxID=3232992 RepID=UPI003F8EB9C6